MSYRRRVLWRDIGGPRKRMRQNLQAPTPPRPAAPSPGNPPRESKPSQDPSRLLQRPIAGGLTVANDEYNDAHQEIGAKQFLYVSSAGMYESNALPPIMETVRACPHPPRTQKIPTQQKIGRAWKEYSRAAANRVSGHEPAPRSVFRLT
eukprot:1187856-Prorocentrum_minimum.AAC.2